MFLCSHDAKLPFVRFAELNFPWPEKTSIEYPIQILFSEPPILGKSSHKVVNSMIYLQITQFYVSHNPIPCTMITKDLQESPQHAAKSAHQATKFAHHGEKILTT